VITGNRDGQTEEALVYLGHSTRYLRQRLAIGLAPEGLKAFVVQRRCWARGARYKCSILRRGDWGGGKQRFAKSLVSFRPRVEDSTFFQAGSSTARNPSKETANVDPSLSMPSSKIANKHQSPAQRLSHHSPQPGAFAKDGQGEIGRFPAPGSALRQQSNEIACRALTLQAATSVLDAPGARCFHAGDFVSANRQDRRT
jgi:hypothetical protein